MSKIFPPVENANKNGLLAIGGHLSTEMLLEAYQNAIFPWPSNSQILWFSPPKRAILHINNYSPSRSLVKEYSKKKYFFKINSNFKLVIESCAKRKETWITDDMILAYCKLNQLGYAISYECYENESLVGGLYCVTIKNFYAGESMFHCKNNGSKLAFHYFIKDLIKKDIKWIDCQIMNPFLHQLGATEIDREIFISMLKEVI